jgi:hypothetical protein
LGCRTYQLHRPLPFMHRLLGARSTPRCAALRSRPLSLERRLRRLGRRRRHAAVRVRSDELAGVAARLPHAVVEHGRRLVRRRSLGFALPALRGALPDLPAVQATKKSREHRDFRVGRALAGAVTRRPPIFPRHGSTRTEGYAYDVGVWDLSIVQGPLSVAPCQPLTFRSQLLHRCTGGADMPVAMQPVSSIACVSRRVSLSGRGEAGAHRWAWSGLKRGADMPMAMQSVSSISSCPPAQPASTSVGDDVLMLTQAHNFTLGAPSPPPPLPPSYSPPCLARCTAPHTHASGPSSAAPCCSRRLTLGSPGRPGSSWQTQGLAQ